MPLRLILSLTLLSGLAISPVSHAMGKKKKQRTMVSFHLETSADEAPKFAFPHTLPGTNIERYFKINPEFTNRQIMWFHPFDSKDGRSNGLVFQLDQAATIRLEAISAQNRGKYLVTSLLGAQSAPILIDRPVDDGVIVVWDGVSDAQIAMLAEEMNQYQDPSNPADPKQYKKDLKKEQKRPGYPDDVQTPILQLPQPGETATYTPSPNQYPNASGSPPPTSPNPGSPPQPWSGATTPLPPPGAPVSQPATTVPSNNTFSPPQYMPNQPEYLPPAPGEDTFNEPPLPQQKSDRGDKTPVYRPGFDR
ncbi:MAG: hypothetical protein AAGD22_03815 [Verrucomicrobiota bacterium]